MKSAHAYVFAKRCIITYPAEATEQRENIYILYNKGEQTIKEITGKTAQNKFFSCLFPSENFQFT